MTLVLKDSSFILPNGSTGARESDEGETAIGIYLLLLGWMSWLGNGVVICIMCKRRQSLDPHDMLTLNLAVSDAGISIFGYSRGIVELFHGLGKDGFLVTSLWTCKVDGFLILLFGLISISTLTAISIFRYVKGCQPHRAHKVHKQSVSMALVFIWISSAIWSGFPLLGWGSFTERKYGTCEIDWSQATRSVSYKCYVIGVFLWGFFIPVSIMVFCYVSIIRTVHASHQSSQHGGISQRQLTMERDITRVSFVICTAFLLAWSPYAVISMWSACGYHVPGLTSVVATLLAKSASFYNPIIYIGLSSKFRQDIQAFLCCFTSCSSESKQSPKSRGTEENKFLSNGSLAMKMDLPRMKEVTTGEVAMDDNTDITDRSHQNINIKLDVGMDFEK
ncbi:opsin-5-like [Spea bombifrons]|uniref:opsin-5-like n=1 Tax=Spea bombifrons TaxID=233779 RepID=UPI00234A3E6E|nr:opsin-5-like [Spea bombifrons]